MRWPLIVCIVVAACGDDGPSAGPDAALPDTPPAPDVPTGFDLTTVPPGCVPDRATSDRSDDLTFDQIRVLYVTPSDGADRAHDTSGKICNSVRAFATWFHDQSGSYLRFDTQGGMLDVGFVRLSKNDTQMRGNDPSNTSIATGTAFVRERIEQELVAMGQIAENKLYAVYYEGSSVYSCGAGAYPPLIIGRVGVMYLGGMPQGQSVSCGDIRPWGGAALVPNYIDYGMAHELVHSMGIVPDAAPNEHAQGHVYDAAVATRARDLMYSPRVGQSDPGWGVDDGLLLDVGGDDYFRAGPVDLARMTLLAPLPANAQRPNGW